MARRRAIPPPPEYVGNTKGQILDVAMRLFALRGYKAVSQKEIAKEVGVNMATMYHHYASKEALFEAVLQRFEKEHQKYNTWLKTKNETADTLEEVMDNIFNEYFLTGLDTAGRFGMLVVLKEQHSSKSAHRALVDRLYREAVQDVQAAFDRFVEKGVIPPSNTHSLATLFMLGVVAVNDLHIHETIETQVPVARAEIYDSMRRLMTSALTLGTLPAKG